jgi:hypothetical protein
VKNNLAPAQPSLAFEVVAEAGASPTLRWHGPSPWRAAQLLADEPRPAPGMARERAKDFLSAFLKGGPRTSHEVWAAVQAEGLSERTLNRAKEDLSIRSERVRNGGAQLSYWLLENQYLPGEDVEFRRALAELEKQYPRPCALDEPDEIQ